MFFQEIGWVLSGELHAESFLLGLAQLQFLLKVLQKMRELPLMRMASIEDLNAEAK